MRISNNKKKTSLTSCDNDTYYVINKQQQHPCLFSVIVRAAADVEIRLKMLK